MIQALALILALLIGTGDKAITLDELYERETIDSTHHYHGDNWEFEDGSFVHTYEDPTHGIAKFTIAGCIPFHLCSWVSVDTPWEDILNETDADYMYQTVDMYKNRPEKFKLFASNYR